MAGGAIATSCTIWNHIDTCDPIADRDRQVNATTVGDQYPQPGRSLARIGPDLFVAAWTSESDPTPNAPSQLRATLIHADGTVKPPCGSSVGDIAISTALDRAVGRPSVAVGRSGHFPIFFVWRSTPSGATQGPGEILVRLMDQDLCPWNSGDQSSPVLTASDATDDGGAPVVAVRSDGLEAIVSWVDLSTPQNLAFRIRSRPVGVVSNADGSAEPNACDGHDAPCTHSSSFAAGPPTITAFGDGYALAWPEQRADGFAGFDVRLELLDRFGAVSADHRGLRHFGATMDLDLASAATSTQILITETSDTVDQSAGDSDIYLERFGPDGVSLGTPVRVNSTLAGLHTKPAVAALNHDGAFVAWETNNGPIEVKARVLDAQGVPVFGGVSCDANDFSLSSVASSRELAPSLSIDGSVLLTTFGDSTMAPGGTDAMGLSVHARRFDIAHLFPILR